MIRKPTIILLGLLALALIAAWVVEFSPWKPTEQVPTSTPRPQLLTGLTSAEITQVILLPSIGEAASLSKDDQGMFVIIDTPEAKANQGKIQQLLSELLALEVTGSADPTASLDVFGFDQATARITLKTANGSQRLVMIGKKTPTGNGYYLRVDGQTPVVVSSSGIDRVLALTSLESISETVATPTP